MSFRWSRNGLHSRFTSRAREGRKRTTLRYQYGTSGACSPDRSVSSQFARYPMHPFRKCVSQVHRLLTQIEFQAYTACLFAKHQMFDQNKVRRTYPAMKTSTSKTAAGRDRGGSCCSSHQPWSGKVKRTGVKFNQVCEAELSNPN